jgi:hypothetical protein
MLPIPDDYHPVVSSSFETEIVDDEVVLLNPTTLRVAHLNGSAALIWRLCDGRRSVAELRALLAAAYPDSAAAVVADLAATLRSLADLGAIADAAN